MFYIGNTWCRAAIVPLITVVVVLLVISITTPTDCSESACTPTTELIAAALRAQDTIPVDVRYVFGKSNSENEVQEALMDYRYVRTNEAAMVEVKTLLQDGTGKTQTKATSFDRASQELRILTTIEPGGISRGEIHFGIGRTLTEQGILETGRYPIFYSPSSASPLLYDVIKDGVVLPTMEIIDGHKCWRIDLLFNNFELKRTLWLDPEIGFCPRRIEFVQTQGKFHSNFKEYKEIAEGIWFPMKLIITSPDEPGTAAGYQVTQIKVGENRPKNDVIVDFISGTKVYDHIRDMEYVAP